jgi:hypothetical protein
VIAFGDHELFHRIEIDFAAESNEKFVAAECADLDAGSVRSPAGFRSRAQPITDRVSLWTGLNDPGYNRRQGLGIGVGRGLGVGWDRGVGVGLIVAVGVALGVLVAVGVGVAVAVGVGDAPPLGETRTK